MVTTCLQRVLAAALVAAMLVIAMPSSGKETRSNEIQSDELVQFSLLAPGLESEAHRQSCSRSR